MAKEHPRCREIRLPASAEITPQMVDRALDALMEFRGEADELLIKEILRAALRPPLGDVARR